MDKWTHIKIKLIGGNRIELSPRKDGIYIGFREIRNIDKITYEQAEVLAKSLLFLIENRAIGEAADGTQS